MSYSKAYNEELKICHHVFSEEKLWFHNIASALAMGYINKEEAKVAIANRTYSIVVRGVTNTYRLVSEVPTNVTH